MHQLQGPTKIPANLKSKSSHPRLEHMHLLPPLLLYPLIIETTKPTSTAHTHKLTCSHQIR